MLAAIRDIDALTPETAAKCRAFILHANAAGLAVFVTETRRSTERQAALYALGRTQPGRIVTRSKAGTGKHEFGLAFDIAFKGADLYPGDSKTWARLGSIGKACGLTWGGDFKGVDSVHFENNETGAMMDIEKNGVDVLQGGKADSVVTVEKPASKLPTLKSATAAALVTGLLAALPAIALVFPAVSPFVGAINAVAKLFGYGV
jgi:peptidoglycan LD-endopeptidase CwlK